jgi:hypothetical protein
MRDISIRKVVGDLSTAMAAIMCSVLFLDADSSQAAIITIVSDSFAGTNGSPVHGRTPDTVNLPGGTWFSVGTGNPSNNPFGAPPTISGNTALLQVNSSAFISLQSSGGYIKPAQFTISGDLRVGSINQNNLGVGLAFNSINSDFSSALRITLGITGDLNFNQTLIASYNAGNFGGNQFDPDSFYHLTYTVDTSTGGVSGITLSNGLGSQNYTLSTTAFTNAMTAFAAIYSNAANVGTSGNIDNFLVSTVPEPSAFMLLLGMGSTVFGWRRRRSVR